MKIRFPLCAIASIFLIAACNRLQTPQTDIKAYDRTYCTNFFAAGSMMTYYLWAEECSDDIASWKYTDDPAAKVKSVRYKDSDGNEIDKWSQLVEDCGEFIGSIEGEGKSYGYDFSFYYYDRAGKILCAVVLYVYPDSPAARAGLRRGDVILNVNGKGITLDNYQEIGNGELYGSGSCILALEDGRTVSMESEERRDDPVYMAEIIDCDGVKVGYLHYTSFAAGSYKRLMEVGELFRESGVKDLILDLRYNGGGATVAAQTLASMMAPRDVVMSNGIYLKTVCNKDLSLALGEDKLIEKFQTGYKFNYNNIEYEYDISESLMNPDRVFVIMTGSTASASEALVCGLMPYTDLTIVGEQSYGKYCGGYMLTAADWYEAYSEIIGSDLLECGMRTAGNTGIYVISERYSDCNGRTLCMPDGFTPDIYVRDQPRDGHQLGDPEETMLAATLQAAGLKAPLKSAQAPVKEMEPAGLHLSRPGSDVLVIVR